MNTMEDIQSGFEEIKISAFSKAKLISPFVHNVTIGPGSLKVQTKISNYVKPTKEKSPNKIDKSYNFQNNCIPFKNILSELETQRMEKVQEAVNCKRTEILNFSNNQSIIKKQKWVERQKNLIMQIQQQEFEIFKALEQHDKDSTIEHEKLLIYYKQLAERKNKNDQAIQAKEERHRRIHKIMDGVLKIQQEFRAVYLEIIQILKESNDQIKLMLTEHVQNLKELTAQMDDIVPKIKLGNNVVEQDATRCRELLDGARKLRDSIKNVIVIYNKKLGEIKDAQNQAQAIENASVKQPQTESLQFETKQIDNQNQTTATSTKNEEKLSLNTFVSKSSFKTYSEHQLFLKNHENSFLNLLHDANAKDFRFDCKKAVNIPVNAISDTNASHLLDKYHKLHNLLAGKVVQIGDKQILATRHPQGISYSMDLLTKKFVFQGDLLLSGNRGDRLTAFSYAAIIVALWNDFPDFGKLLLAVFHKQCPYLVPIYLPRNVDQTDEDYYVSLGYQYVNGAVEEQNKFLKRMTGIMRLYCAILITKPKQGHTQHPHSLNYGWRWLAAILNMEPKADITATLIYVFLEVCGSSMVATYGIQFKKILDYMCNVFMPLLKQNDAGGPVSRLEEMLKTFIKVGYFEPPKGVLPNYFW